VLEVELDIKPTSCPNPFNIKLFTWAEGELSKKGGVLPVAIVGSPSFDVNDIDFSTVRLEGVAPLVQGSGASDVTQPAGDEECACTEAGPDGILDLQMKFSAQAIADAIAPGFLGDRALTLTGQLLDGTDFVASDCIRIVGKAIPPVIPDVPVLNPAVPNPFNPVTRITYLLPVSERVTLAVYDVSGKAVALLDEGVRGAGEHVVEWNAAGLASGVYFVHLRAGDATEVRRVTLLK
jgi:hypothetical protein